MITASAPGKVILFGEHAVVFGTKALGTAIDLRAWASIEEVPGRLEVETSNFMLADFSLDLITGNIKSIGASNFLRYVSAVLEEFKAKDLRVKLRSEIPPAAGLGSSAAIVVATLAALNEYMGLGLSRPEIASSAYRIEKTVQKGLGSPMDTALSTFGRYLLVSQEVQPVNLPELELAVGYTEKQHDTRSEVQKVQNLRSIYPDIVDPIFQAIGAISAKSIPLIKEKRLRELGQMMNFNHGLLEAVGVSTRELCELVYAARSPGGALGAKLTGAGGGGCMIALPPEEGSRAILTAIAQAKGRAFAVKTGCDGVRLES